MQTREIITAPNGKRGLIIASFSDKRALLDGYSIDERGQITGELTGICAPFPAEECEKRSAEMRSKILEILEAPNA